MPTDPHAAKSIFLAAVDIAAMEERAAFLDQACGTDTVLRGRVEELLHAHARPDDFLDRPLPSPAVEVPEGEATAQPSNSQLDYLRSFLAPATRPGALGRLAHYEVLEVLGQGGFGTVLRAFDDRLHRVVALKVLAPELAASGTARQRFLREARAAASVRNEHVVDIHAVDEQPIPFLVMEYVAGQTLQAKLDQEGALGLKEILRIAYQAALGLAAAHKQGVIHRDIKPANILLENGVERVKLSDFGLARTRDDAVLTQSGVVAGTPAFMSPEQAEGRSLDHRSDLFSLGSTLYAMCTGRPPFRASGTLAVLKRVCEDTPRPIREVNGEIPAWLCAVVERLHAKKPEERFPSARDVAELLTTHLADLQLHGVSEPNADPLPDPENPEGIEAMAASSPKIQVKCSCGAVLAVPAQRAGVTVTCPKCAQPVKVPAATPASWYVARKKRKQGPYTPAQLKQMAAAGQLQPEDMVLREGEKQWVEAATVRGLFPEAAPARPGPHTSKPGAPWLLIGAGAAAVVLLIAGIVVGLLVVKPWLTRRTEPPPPVASRDDGDKDSARPPNEKPPDDPRPAPKRALDLSFIPAGVSSAVIVHPRQLLGSPLMPALPPGAGVEMVQALGVQPEQIEQVIVLLQAPAAGPSVPPPKDTWVVLESREGRFSLRFPVQPAPSQRKTPLGTRQVFTAETDGGELTLEISYVDFAKDSPIVGDLSRVDFATRALEFKPSFKEKKDIKLGKYLGAEVVLDDAQLKTYSVHRVYIVGDRLYHLEATSRKAQKPPLEFARFFSSFQVGGADAPAPTDLLPPDLVPVPGAIVRFAAPVNGKLLLTRLLGGVREAKHQDKVYYLGPDEPGPLGLPLAGHVADDRTLLLAPEPLLQAMLTATGAKGPLLDRLRQADAGDDLTAIVLLGPNRKLLKALTQPMQALLPPPLAGVAGLPEQLVGVTLTANLGSKTMARLTFEANDATAAQAVEKLVRSALDQARQAYPELRPALSGQMPPSSTPALLRLADQLYGGVQVARQGAQVVVTLDRPPAVPELAKDLIAAAGFNDAEGLSSDPVPSSPYPLNTSGKVGGLGEPGWAGPWTPAHPAITFEKKVVFEGDGACHVTGVDNIGPGFSRRLAEPQRGVFQVELHMQVPEGGRVVVYLKNENHYGPNWQVQDGKFQVLEAGVPPETGFACRPGMWHKVTVRVDVRRREWTFAVDDKLFLPKKLLKFRGDAPDLDLISFLCRTGPGAYIDALKITRLPADAVAKSQVSKPVPAMPPDHIASTGFNSAKGLHGDPEDGPFPLDVPNREGGDGEPGWAGLWPAFADAISQSKVVFEGDGALYLKGAPNVGPNYGRQLAKAQTGTFQVEYYLQVPAGSNCVGYVWQDPWTNGRGGPFHSGPNWGAGNGKFWAGHGGEQSGSVNRLDTGFDCKPGKWYKVTLRIDVPKQTWDFFVDDKRFAPPQPLKFRSKVAYLDVINFLVEGGVYIDALRITRLPAAKP